MPLRDAVARRPSRVLAPPEEEDPELVEKRAEYLAEADAVDQARIDDLDARPERSWQCLDCGKDRAPLAKFFPCRCGGLSFAMVPAHAQA